MTMFNPELHLTVGQLRRIGVALDSALPDDAYIEKSSCQIEAHGPLSIDAEGALIVPVRVLFMQPLANITLNVKLNHIGPTALPEPSPLPGDQKP